jgi:hypothetical protein
MTNILRVCEGGTVGRLKDGTLHTCCALGQDELGWLIGHLLSAVKELQRIKIRGFPIETGPGSNYISGIAAQACDDLSDVSEEAMVAMMVMSTKLYNSHLYHTKTQRGIT